MSGLLLAAASAAAAAALLAGSSGPGAEPLGPAEARTPIRPQGADDSPPEGTVVRLVCAMAGAAAAWLVGGLPGVVVGLAVAGIGPPAIGRMESSGARHRRADLVRAAPVVADLLAASMAAGVPLEAALPVVARAVGGPAGDELAMVHRRTSLGEPAAQAWARVGDLPGLAGIGRTVMRSSRTGAPLARLLEESAEQLRIEAGNAALEQVRAASVRAVLPLGLCLLPAFALLGIAPVVGGLLPSL